MAAYRKITTISEKSCYMGKVDFYIGGFQYGRRINR